MVKDLHCNQVIFKNITKTCSKSFGHSSDIKQIAVKTNSGLFEINSSSVDAEVSCQLMCSGVFKWKLLLSAVGQEPIQFFAV